ncbi:hypothetical protein MKX34_24050 [Paenibacillus sp. FSL R5-0636]|uniref:hypothetical protein n=1 Tax=Paenibacillus TaxID=44249 RepID=UPI00096D27E5|nr:hypothetical protein [Paenibacillus odorifer]OMC96241.1 hypothetical protein BJP49_11105 [Paenibacillus odorifer]
MTKLNVVIPAVNVMVEIDGSNVEFRKVDRKAQAGDIVKVTESGEDIEAGAFYNVLGDYSFADGADDSRQLSCWKHEVYAPVVSAGTADAPADLTFESAQYRKVDRSAREGDVIVFAEAPRSYLTSGKAYLVNEIDFAGGAQITDDDGDDYDMGASGIVFDVYEKVSVETPAASYREVKRKAAVGERIKIVNPVAAIDYVMGDEFTVIEIDEEGNVYFRDTVNERNSAYLREYVVLEPVNTQVKAKPKRFSAGDYVKVTGNSVCHDYTEGSVVMITETKDNARYGGQQFRAETVDGKRGNWLVTYNVEPATETEFLAQRKPAEPVRLKIGDYAKVLAFDMSYASAAIVGLIVELTETDHSNRPYRGKKLDGTRAGWFTPDQLTPATAEEVSAARAEAQRKIAVGPFADGGFAQIVDVSKSQALGGFSTGDYVNVVSDGFNGRYKLVVTKTSGNRGYCNADALRQITEAEYNAAVAPKDPRDAFAKGDKVRLISGANNSGLYGFTDGGIYTVANPKSTQWESKRIGIEDAASYGFALPDQLVKLSAEEIAAIEKETQEIAKWAKLGRKVGEFKHGDVVTSAKYCGNTKIVTAQIEDVGTDLLGLRAADGEYHAVDKEGVKLIVPVEQRFDTEQAA